MIFFDLALVLALDYIYFLFHIFDEITIIKKNSNKEKYINLSEFIENCQLSLCIHCKLRFLINQMDLNKIADLDFPLFSFCIGQFHISIFTMPPKFLF
jgi:hypothetical protein